MVFYSGFKSLMGQDLVFSKSLHKHFSLFALPDPLHGIHK